MRLRALLRGRATDGDLEEEFRFHLDMQIAKNLRSGLSAAEARRQALLHFGGVDRHREAMLDGSGARWLDDLLGDSRIALRGLRRTPGFTAVAVLTLAIGIGATTSIFSAVNSVLLQPLPYADAGELIVVYGRHAGLDITGSNISYPDYQDWKRDARSFDELGLFQWTNDTYTAGEDRAERVAAAEVTANLFPLLGVAPILGRGFTPDEEQVGRDRVVVLGHALWQRRFGGDQAILGQTVTLDGEAHTVIGIMPVGFRFPYSGESWTPLAPSEDHLERANRFIAGAVGRLADGVSLEQAEAELTMLSRQMAGQYPESNVGWEADPLPLREDLFDTLQPALVLLFAAVGVVLLVVCGNLANLLLARGAARRREVALRIAVGARRGRLVRQFLTEGCVLALLGGSLGVVLSIWGTSLLRGMLTDRLPAFVELRADPIVFMFALGATALVALLFALLPALRATTVDAQSELKEGARTSGGRRTARLRDSLVVTEVALAMMLLIGSVLLIRTMSALSDIRMGFEPAGILTARYYLPSSEYEMAARRAFLEQLLERVRALPGVERASAAQGTPFSGWNVGTRYEVAGEPPAPVGQALITHVQYITPDFFPTLRVPMLRGRDFVASDNDSIAMVAIVNESFVARHFPGQNPLGKLVRMNPNEPWLTIVGVVADYRHYALTEPMRPATYLPFGSNPRLQMTVVIKTTGPAVAMIPTLRRVLAELDPDVPAYDIGTLEDQVARQTWVQRIARDILTAFAATAAFLAVIGLYGVISYAVLRRRHELGIRLALGATPRRVRRLVVRQGLTLGLTGIALGWLVALAAVRLLDTLLFEVEPGDVATFVAAPLVVLVLAVLATWLPARRAAALDPVRALRNE